MVFRISPGQLQAMNEVWALPQVEELFDHVQEQLGLARPIQPEYGRRLLTEAVMTARRHLLADPEALRRYALLVVQVGDDLGHDPSLAWAGPILDDPWSSDAEKVSYLEQAAKAQGMLTGQDLGRDSG